VFALLYVWPQDAESQFEVPFIDGTRRWWFMVVGRWACHLQTIKLFYTNYCFYNPYDVFRGLAAYLIENSLSKCN
jgi:hypothetical protein